MIRERLEKISEGLLLHEARRRRAREFGRKIEKALDFEEARSQTPHISAATYNRISFGFMPGSHEYFFQEVILGDTLTPFPYRERFETRKGEIIHTRVRTDGRPLSPDFPLGVSGHDLRKIDKRLEDIKNRIFR